jgi:galactose mutarotase-like enzyme
MTITLTSDRMRVTLDLAFGARITSLTDLRSGRQWLVAGPNQGQTGDDATYGAAEALGWDECFPTISKGRHPAWGDLRDHGSVWGRPWQVTGQPDAGHCTAAYTAPDFVFERALSLQGAVLTARYRVTNHAARPLPYLWSQHALLATAPPDELRLHGMPELVTGGTRYDWPHHPARNLTEVGPLGEGFMLKSYAMAAKSAAAEVIGPNGGIRFDWSDDLPAFGLWLDYGGWPQDGPVHQIAFEPTTAMADDLAQAERLGQLRWLPPGQTHDWSVRISLTDGSVGTGAPI